MRIFFLLHTKKAMKTYFKTFGARTFFKYNKFIIILRSQFEEAGVFSWIYETNWKQNGDKTPRKHTQTQLEQRQGLIFVGKSVFMLAS